MRSRVNDSIVVSFDTCAHPDKTTTVWPKAVCGAPKYAAIIFQNQNSFVRASHNKNSVCKSKVFRKSSLSKRMRANFFAQLIVNEVDDEATNWKGIAAEIAQISAALENDNTEMFRVY